MPRVHNLGIEFDLDGNIRNDIAARRGQACGEIEKAFADFEGRVAAIILEPTQGAKAVTCTSARNSSPSCANTPTATRHS
ncbi:MAG: hypothetical protein R3F17_12495 [Planctomycetota bacterium]